MATAKVTTPCFKTSPLKATSYLSTASRHINQHSSNKDSLKDHHIGEDGMSSMQLLEMMVLNLMQSFIITSMTSTNIATSLHCVKDKLHEAELLNNQATASLAAKTEEMYGVALICVHLYEALQEAMAQYNQVKKRDDVLAGVMEEAKSA